MRTAIIITGEMRTFDKCLPTLHWHIFRHYRDADFYVSTVMDGKEATAQLLRTKYPNAHVEIAVVPSQPDCVSEMRGKGVSLPAEWIRGQPYTHEPYAISVPPKAILGQLWQLRDGWRLYKAAERPADRVIRCRPDLWFHSADLEHVSGEINAWSAHVPWWGRFGGVNDRFAVLGADAAKAYFTTYDQIPVLMDAGCPLHPESLVMAALDAAACYINPRLDVFFSTLHTNGELRAPEVSWPDVAAMRA